MFYGTTFEFIPQDYERRMLLNGIHQMYPMTIMADSHGGAFSGGQYTAWMIEEHCIPYHDDEEFWIENTKYVGLGNTPQIAHEDLYAKMRKVYDIGI